VSIHPLGSKYGIQYDDRNRGKVIELRGNISINYQIEIISIIYYQLKGLKKLTIPA
jgi:hypothetical protein